MGLKNTKSYAYRYMLQLVDPIYTKLGFNAKPDDSHLDIKLRKKAVSVDVHEKISKPYICFPDKMGLQHGSQRLLEQGNRKFWSLDGNG